VAVSPKGIVVVRAPHNTDQARITDFTERIKPWIFKHLARYRRSSPPRDFVTGETLPYLGKKFKLRIVYNDTKILPVLVGGHINVYVARHLNNEARREAVRQALIRWYGAQAQQVLPARLAILAQRLGAHPVAVKVKCQASRWGSCTARGVINLNWQLIMAPTEVADYVIIHELCHLRIHGHQQEFWEYVAQHTPDYKALRKWLRINVHALGFLST